MITRQLGLGPVRACRADSGVAALAVLELLETLVRQEGVRSVLPPVLVPVRREAPHRPPLGAGAGGPGHGPPPRGLAAHRVGAGPAAECALTSRPRQVTS